MHKTLDNMSAPSEISYLLTFLLLLGGTFGCDDPSTPAESVQEMGGEMISGEVTGGEVIGGETLSGERAGGEVSGGEALSGEVFSGEMVASSGEQPSGEVGGEEQPMSVFPPPPAGYPLFSFPIHADDRDLMRPDPVFGFDHDPSEGVRIRCTDYAGRGFPHCYDEHKGSDFMLSGGFDAMDAGSARVVAALSGEVVSAEDGNYDRCHADLLSADVTCDGHPMRANFVKIRHDNGWISMYYHLKRGSVQVRRGQLVECGEVLGLVGSSGYSSAPHLHFEVEGLRGERWDPFAGPESQDFSLWISQPELSEPTDSSSFPINSCSSPSR